LATVSRAPGAGQGDDDHRPGVARAMLIAGGSFATAISAVLGACGLWGLGDRAMTAGLGALCFIAALTMFTVAWIMRR
jgi:hypothetical protein